MPYERERDFAILTVQKAGRLLLRYHGKQNDPERHKLTNFKTILFF